MKVTIECNTDDDPKAHDLVITDEGFDVPGWAELIVEGRTVTVWVPDLSKALMPFIAKYEENKAA